ncbi:hypothetical protein PVAP13_8NG173100 [Panicum virgatum]|uniref:Uncharacterized protein n=1 Tax=Panicum virgatum TaxID=38727 RepID=A0A8T0P4R9_PANVG|nr:hypothetical protein PVAP13_8NG173100 [Panicum virgatum]
MAPRGQRAPPPLLCGCAAGSHVLRRRCPCAPPRSAAPCSVPPPPFGAARRPCAARGAAAPPPLQCPAARLPTPSAAVAGCVRRWCRSHPPSAPPFLPLLLWSANTPCAGHGWPTATAGHGCRRRALGRRGSMCRAKSPAVLLWRTRWCPCSTTPLPP